MEANFHAELRSCGIPPTVIASEAKQPRCCYCERSEAIASASASESLAALDSAVAGLLRRARMRAPRNDGVGVASLRSPRRLGAECFVSLAMTWWGGCSAA